MKIQAEISYILESEPDEFKTVEEINTRSVYMWLDKRGYLNNTTPWTVCTRQSINLTYEQGHGIMEVWLLDNEISDPHKNTDDIWTENYKTIQKKNHTIEWHPMLNMLRLIWVQNTETIRQKKLIAPIITSLEQFELDFPGFPVLIFSE